MAQLQYSPKRSGAQERPGLGQVAGAASQKAWARRKGHSNIYYIYACMCACMRVSELGRSEMSRAGMQTVAA